MIRYKTYALPPELRLDGLYRIAIDGGSEGVRIVKVEFTGASQSMVLHVLSPTPVIDYREHAPVPNTSAATCIYVELLWTNGTLHHLDAKDFVDVVSMNGYDVAVFASVRA